MSEDIQTADAPPPAAAKKKVTRAKPKKRAPRVAKQIIEADRPVTVGAGNFAGISATSCPSACTETHCVISTVSVCKHPNKTGDNGCGQITTRNRERARKLIKHQMIDMRG